MEVGLSVISFLPHIMLPGGLRFCTKYAEKAGIEFWQMLPFRGINAKSLNNTLPCRYVESAWNPISFLEKIRRKEGPEGPATWLDVIFFPGPATSKARLEMILNYGAQLVSHHLEDVQRGALVEVRPELGKTGEEILAFAKSYGPCLVLDTRHLQRPGPNPLLPWITTLEMLLPYAKLIHIQPLDKEEFTLFLQGKHTQLEEAIKLIKEQYQGPYVIEIPPNLCGLNFLSPTLMARKLKDFCDVFFAL